MRQGYTYWGKQNAIPCSAAVFVSCSLKMFKLRLYIVRLVESTLAVCLVDYKLVV